MSQCPNLGDHCQREGFHPSRRGVLLFPGTEQSSKTKIHFALGVQTRVRGPHCGIRLTHRS